MIWLIPITVLLAYGIMICRFAFGWARVRVFDEKDESKHADTPFISVVVACRNEEKNLPKFLENIKNQSFRNFELVLIDDGSSDLTYERMRSFRADFPVKIVPLTSPQGKKAALRQGIAASQGDLIVTTDADSLAPSDWLLTIALFQAKNNCEMIILPLVLEKTVSNSIFSQLQQMEFATLVASGAGAAGAGDAILCNGANLAFKPSAFFAAADRLHPEEPSGDDIFLLENIKRQGGRICFLKSQKAMVVTQEAQTLQQFFQQRRRWAGKAPAYSDKTLITTSLIVLFISFLQILLLFAGLFCPSLLALLAAVTAGKWAVDTGFLFLIRDFFSVKNVIINSLLLSVVYPFYVCAVAFAALLKKPKRW